MSADIFLGVNIDPNKYWLKLEVDKLNINLRSDYIYFN